LIFQISASWVERITGISHWHLALSHFNWWRAYLSSAKTVYGNFKIKELVYINIIL
jgi:hypothetical protein